MAKLALADPLDCSEMQKRWVEKAKKVVSLYKSEPHQDTYIKKYGQGAVESLGLDEVGPSAVPSDDAYDAVDNTTWDVLDEMEDWLAQIWVASRDRSAEAERAAECLKFCYDSIVGFRPEYGRESEDVELRDSSGKLLCSGYTHGILVFSTLREVLVNVYLAGDESTVPRIEGIMRQGWDDYNDELDTVFDAEDEEYGEDEEDVDEEDEEKIEKVEKLTDAARAARARVREGFRGTARDRAWTRFVSSSLTDYDWNCLLREFPDMKDRALASARQKYLVDKKAAENLQKTKKRIPSSRSKSEDTARDNNATLSEGISCTPAEGPPSLPQSSADKTSYKDQLLSRFASKLDGALYNRLVHEFPDAKDDALETARATFLAEKPSSSTCWSDAFDILSKSEKIEDIDRLLRSMPSFADRPDTEESRIRAVQFLFQSPSHRDTALSSLMDGLRATSKAFLDDLHSCFPDIDDACGALILEFSRGDLRRYCAGTAHALTTRSQELDRFVKTALGGPRHVPMVPLSHGLSIAERLRGWMGVLNELPRWMPRKRMLAIRDDVMGEIGNDRLFKDAGDFAEILMLRCHGRRKETEEALREAYNLFAPAKPVIAQTPMSRGGKRDRLEQGTSNKKARYG